MNFLQTTGTVLLTIVHRHMHVAYLSEWMWLSMRPESLLWSIPDSLFSGPYTSAVACELLQTLCLCLPVLWGCTGITDSHTIHQAFRGLLGFWTLLFSLAYLCDSTFTRDNVLSSSSFVFLFGGRIPRSHCGLEFSDVDCGTLILRDAGASALQCWG